MKVEKFVEKKTIDGTSEKKNTTQREHSSFNFNVEHKYWAVHKSKRQPHTKYLQNLRKIKSDTYMKRQRRQATKRKHYQIWERDILRNSLCCNWIEKKNYKLSDSYNMQFDWKITKVTWIHVSSEFSSKQREQ